jgi:hypothetical protein
MKRATGFFKGNISIMYRWIPVFCLVLVSLDIQAQMLIPSIFHVYPKIQWDGYVCFKTFGCSRQVVDYLDGDVTLYPLPYAPDKYGCDIFSQPNAGFTTVQTRLRHNAKFDELHWCKEVNAYVESDFTGVSAITYQCFRMRQAYADMVWEFDHLAIGQMWHPAFILDCFPDTIAFSNGAPIEMISRDNMIRYDHTFGSWGRLTLAATQQAADFGSYGPLAPGALGQSTVYQRNAVMPAWHIQWRFMGTDGFIGAYGDVKRLVPRLVTDQDVKAYESLVSGMFGVFGSVIRPYWRLSAKAMYVQNPTDYTMLGGYGVASIQEGSGRYCYTPTQVVSVWVDSAYERGRFAMGAFVGVTQNLGTTKNLYKKPADGFILFARDPEIDYVWRIAPRIIFTTGPFRLAAEVEYTVAAWGTVNDRGRVDNACPVGNIHALLASYYFF